MTNSDLLFITSFHPGASGEIGAGEAISEDSLRQLNKTGKRIHVICLAPPNQFANPDVVALCASYQTLNQSWTGALLGVLRNLSRGALFAPWFFTRVSSRNLQAVLAAVHEKAISEVWIDFPSSLGFASHLTNVPIEYFAHDVVSQKIGRQTPLRGLVPWVRHVESVLLGRVGRCRTLSEKDAQLLRDLGFLGSVKIAPPARVQVGSVANGVPVGQLIEQFPGRKNLVFFGNMRRAENHWSMISFLLGGFPRIRKTHPDAHLWILGLSPRLILRVLGRLLPGVHVVGAVDDPAPAFSAATLCVAPLRLGAGVKIKVLQMLEAGATVVATPVGAEGIEPGPKLVVVEDAQFADVVTQLLAGDQCQTA